MRRAQAAEKADGTPDAPEREMSNASAIGKRYYRDRDTQPFTPEEERREAGKLCELRETYRYLSFTLAPGKAYAAFYKLEQKVQQHLLPVWNLVDCKAAGTRYAAPENTASEDTAPKQGVYARIYKRLARTARNLRSLEERLHDGAGSNGGRRQDLEHTLLDRGVRLIQKLSPEPEALYRISREVRRQLAGQRRYRRVYQQLAEAESSYYTQRNRFLRANLRLVAAYVWNLRRKRSIKGIDVEDLIQEGNLGLLRAVEKYNYRRDNKFSTYATYWIRHFVDRAIIGQSSDIRLPVHIHDARGNVFHVEQILAGELGRAPTLNDIGKRMGIPPEEVCRLQELYRRPLSLQIPAGEDGERTLEDFLSQSQFSSVEEALGDYEFREKMSNLVNSRFQGRELLILRKRFGIGSTDGEDAHTLEELGEHFDISRERVRQLEVIALTRLRHPKWRKELQKLDGSIWENVPEPRRLRQR